MPRCKLSSPNTGVEKSLWNNRYRLVFLVVHRWVLRDQHQPWRPPSLLSSLPSRLSSATCLRQRNSRTPLCREMVITSERQIGIGVSDVPVSSAEDRLGPHQRIALAQLSNVLHFTPLLEYIASRGSKDDHARG